MTASDHEGTFAQLSPNAPIISKPANRVKSGWTGKPGNTQRPGSRWSLLTWDRTCAEAIVSEPHELFSHLSTQRSQACCCRPQTQEVGHLHTPLVQVMCSTPLVCKPPAQQETSLAHVGRRVLGSWAGATAAPPSPPALAPYQEQLPGDASPECHVCLGSVKHEPRDGVQKEISPRTGTHAKLKKREKTKQ